MNFMKPISFALNVEQLAKLERIAKFFGKNRSAFIQTLIDELPDPVESSLKFTRPNVVCGCNVNVEQAADVMGGFIGCDKAELLAQMGKNQCGLAMLLELAMAGENILLKAQEDE